ncbi:MAG TPA: hypothetical protein V6C89_11135 [Drouetiella sp.]|jgi:hypothetical protein
MPNLKTPANKFIYLLLLNLAWFSNMPALVQYYQFCLARGDYPVHADSISIPIFQCALGLVILAPIINLIAYLLLRRSKLPAPLLMPFGRNAQDSIFCAICLLLSLYLVYSWMEMLFDAPIAGWMLLPSTAVSLYLTWSMRAGMINRRNT